MVKTTTKDEEEGERWCYWSKFLKHCWTGSKLRLSVEYDENCARLFSMKIGQDLFVTKIEKEIVRWKLGKIFSSSHNFQVECKFLKFHPKWILKVRNLLSRINWWWRWQQRRWWWWWWWWWRRKGDWFPPHRDDGTWSHWCDHSRPHQTTSKAMSQLFFGILRAFFIVTDPCLQKQFSLFYLWNRIFPNISWANPDQIVSNRRI